MRHDNEFPLLPALGLYAADIRGDGKPYDHFQDLTDLELGNCLFNALSDQIYGDQSSHALIRARVIDYMRAHADYYKQFIDVHPGGGIRRNPKRKATFSSSSNVPKPTQADIDRVFETHLLAMAKGGTYGDNMEITAFSSAFGVDVRIYQRDLTYVITGMRSGTSIEPEAERPIAHIAYHMWEHYSSIRNLDGPHQGVPNVSPRTLTPEEEAAQEQLLRETPLVQPWQIELVQTSLNYIADRATIKKALEAARGNINAAVSALLDEQEHGSASSAQESSSVEHGHESDAEMSAGPPKRRTSRARRARRSMQTRYALANIDAVDGSQDSVGSWESSETSSMYGSSRQDTMPTTSFDSSSSRLNSESRPNSPPRKPAIHLHTNSPQSVEVRALRYHRAGKSFQRQHGPRATARDRDLKKRAQKAAGKEFRHIAAQAAAEPVVSGDGIAVHQRPTTDTPPLDTLRTLYI